MKKLTYLRDGEKLSEAVIRKPSNCPPLHEQGLRRGFTSRDPQAPPPRRPGNPSPSP